MGWLKLKLNAKNIMAIKSQKTASKISVLPNLPICSLHIAQTARDICRERVIYNDNIAYLTSRPISL